MASPTPLDVDEPVRREPEAAGKMSFFDHLNELRKRIIYSAAAILLGAFVGFAVAKKSTELSWPARWSRRCATRTSKTS
jgi:Sec-independent protein secretion pathway component TatC